MLPLLLLGCVDTTADRPYRERDLAVDEIRAKLASEDFHERLEASKQIERLDPAEKFRVLLVLADDPNPATRLLAVQKLKPIAAARDRLARMAKEDPDPDVRDLAAAIAILPADPWWFTVSRGGSGAAWAERRGREVVVHHDGHTYGPYP